MNDRKMVLAVCAAVLALAGCADKAGPARSTTTLPESPTTASSSTPRPVPDGPLTPTGTTLGFGEVARVMYETQDQGKERTKIAVAPVSVKHGSVGDFDNVDLEPDVKAMEFFYVTVSFTNLGPLPMNPTGTAVYVTVHPYDTTGTKMDLLSIMGSFSPCDHESTDALAVGATYTACAVYVAPKTQDVGKLVFTYNDYVSTPGSLTEITWPPR